MSTEGPADDTTPGQSADSATPGRQAGAADAEERVEDERARRDRVERAVRRYRATLRNETETGHSGYSDDHYRSQKPPHWGTR